MSNEIPLIGHGLSSSQVEAIQKQFQGMVRNFPIHPVPIGNNQWWSGMTLHDYYTGMAIQGLLANPEALKAMGHDMMRVVEKSWEISNITMGLREEYYTLMHKKAEEKAEAEKLAQTETPKAS